jgi:hypothetical protein
MAIAFKKFRVYESTIPCPEEDAVQAHSGRERMAGFDRDSIRNR